MALRVQRCFKIDREHRLELDKKGVGIDFGNKKISDILSLYIKLSEEFNVDAYGENNNSDISESKEKLEQYLKEIVGLHKSCGDKINWQSLSDMKEPFEDESNGPRKIKAEEDYENFSPTILEKVFKFMAEKRKSNLLKKIDEAQAEDKLVLDEFKKIKEFSNEILDGNIDAYFQLIDEIRPFYKLTDYGSKIEFGTNDKDSIEVEFNANSKIVIPDVIYRENENGKSEKDNMDTAEYYDVVQDYVSSATIMIAKKTMNLLPVNKVVVHAVDNVKDYETGLYKDITILSVVFDRETLDKLNLKSMESTLVLDNFICNMRHQKATGFRSVERITQY
ncbi:MAG: hypothetical protein Q4F66_13385 [Clostridium sp.]|nr:hypothetical protein [Clostridium sp.]